MLPCLAAAAVARDAEERPQPMAPNDEPAPSSAPAVRVGVAGWARPEFEACWPAAGELERLAALARAFGCVELDATRHAIPAAHHVERWIAALAAGDAEERAPAGCRALLQAPAALLARDEPPPELVAGFADVAQRFARRRRLGALLATYDAALLHGPSELRRVARLAGSVHPHPLIVELPHPSWREPSAVAALRGIGCSLALADSGDARQRPPAPQRPTGPLGLLRVGGSGVLPPPVVGALARRAASLASEVSECYVVAANVAGGAALATAFELRWLLEGRRPLAPWPALVSRFPHLGALATP